MPAIHDSSGSQSTNSENMYFTENIPDENGIKIGETTVTSQGEGLYTTTTTITVFDDIGTPKNLTITYNNISVPPGKDPTRYLTDLFKEKKWLQREKIIDLVDKIYSQTVSAPNEKERSIQSSPKVSNNTDTDFLLPYNEFLKINATLEDHQTLKAASEIDIKNADDLRERIKLTESIPRERRTLQFNISLGNDQNRLGLMLKRENNLNSAVQYFKKAIKNGSAYAAYNLAILYSEAGSLGEQLNYLEKSIKINNKNSPIKGFLPLNDKMTSIIEGQIESVKAELESPGTTKLIDQAIYRFANATTNKEVVSIINSLKEQVSTSTLGGFLFNCLNDNRNSCRGAGIELFRAFTTSTLTNVPNKKTLILCPNRIKSLEEFIDFVDKQLKYITFANRVLTFVNRGLLDKSLISASVDKKLRITHKIFILNFRTKIIEQFKGLGPYEMLKEANQLTFENINLLYKIQEASLERQPDSPVNPKVSFAKEAMRVDFILENSKADISYKKTKGDRGLSPKDSAGKIKRKERSKKNQLNFLDFLNESKHDQ